MLRCTTLLKLVAMRLQRLDELSFIFGIQKIERGVHFEPVNRQVRSQGLLKYRQQAWLVGTVCQ